MSFERYKQYSVGLKNPLGPYLILSGFRYEISVEMLYNIFLEFFFWSLTGFILLEKCVICMFLCRDALTKMKEVYIKNPQMGDPNSVDPRLAEIAHNIEKLQAEAQKFEVSVI